jgi:hypothetical protein
VNEDGKETFTLRKRDLSHSPKRQRHVYIAPSSPWQPSWEVLVRDMYLYDFKFNPPSTEEKVQFNEWLEKETHPDYGRWLEEPLGTIEPPEDIKKWIYRP